MKVLKKSVIKLKNQEDHTKTERKILAKVYHPYIVNLQYAFQDKLKLYLITEFMQGGELFYHLRKEGIFKEFRAKFYLCEIVLALEHLHKNNCIYRDLKPENILLGSNGHIKLTDFGLSKIVISKKDDRAFTICGTPEYLAPEIITEKGYDKSVDWWSLGALFYEMLAGFSPFKQFNHSNDLDVKIYLKPVKMHSFFSEEAKSLIQDLLTVNPKLRLGYGVNGSKNVKSHSFFKDVDWDAFMENRVEPPTKPHIRYSEDKKEPVDLSNFDPMFTKENCFSPSMNNHNISNHTTYDNLNNSVNQVHKSVDDYDGFTYIKKDDSLLN